MEVLYLTAFCIFALTTQLVDQGKVSLADIESELGLCSESVEAALQVICCWFFSSSHKLLSVSTSCVPTCNNWYIHLTQSILAQAGGICISFELSLLELLFFPQLVNFLFFVLAAYVFFRIYKNRDFKCLCYSIWKVLCIITNITSQQKSSL